MQASPPIETASGAPVGHAVTREDRNNAQASADVVGLLSLITSGALSQVVAVAAELGVPDLLARGPQSADDLARATQCHGLSLLRLLRALTAAGLCTHDDEGTFGLTRAGSLLCTDAETPFSAYAIWWGKYRWLVWGHLLHSIRSGESARALVNGKRGFQDFEDDPEAAQLFHRAMAELTRIVGRAALASCDFSGITRVVDVGGGYGELLALMLHAYPHMRGVLFDLPHSVEGARAHLTRAGVLDRCDVVAGDFLHAVPSGGDAYLLKTVLHDWNDDDAATILHNCRTAGPDARLLLVERVMPERVQPCAHDRGVTVAQLNMLVMLGGQ